MQKSNLFPFKGIRAGIRKEEIGKRKGKQVGGQNLKAIPSIIYHQSLGEI
jgi:hypothetical protein